MGGRDHARDLTRTEIQDIAYDAAARIGIAHASDGPTTRSRSRRRFETADRLATSETLAVAVEVLAPLGRGDRIEELALAAGITTTGRCGSGARPRPWGGSRSPAAGPKRQPRCSDERRSRRRPPGLARWTRRSAAAAPGPGALGGGPVRSETAPGRCSSSWPTGAPLAGALRGRACRGGARAAARARASRLPGSRRCCGRSPSCLPLGERLVTSLFVDVRDYTGMAQSSAPAANAGGDRPDSPPAAPSPRSVAGTGSSTSSPATP